MCIIATAKEAMFTDIEDFLSDSTLQSVNKLRACALIISKT